MLNPSDWPDRERQFHLEYLANSSRFPSTPVSWRFVEGTGRGVGLGTWAVEQIRHRARGAPWNQDPLIAVWRSPKPGAVADLIFEIDGRPRANTGTGVLVGMMDVNGALCLVTDRGEELWPVYNPRPPQSRAPVW